MAVDERKPKVLRLGEIGFATEAWAALGDVATLVHPEAANRQDFIKECESGALDGVLVACRTFASVAITGRIDDELLQALPQSLKFICHNGAGYDQIDVKACTAHGIRVSNTPTAVDDSTADTGIFLMLGALRNFAPSIATLREGTWQGKPAVSIGRDPQGKTLGILGMGGIGKNMAAKVRAFGMRIRYHNRTKLSEEQEEGAEYVDFETLLKESDVLSLNLPLNPKTRHIISTPQFEIMKKGIVIINTARGAVMDEAALVAALDSGRVSSAGLDVYENEPEVHPGLVANPKVLLLPHMGTNTVETSKKMEEWTLANVRSVVDAGKLKSVVPEQRNMG